MDKDLEELKVKAQQMLKKCREDDLSVENLPDVRKSLNNLLNDIKSHKLLEDVEFMKIAKELGNEVVNFINTDLAELQKSAEEKISAAETPAAQAVKPPVKRPMNPSVSMASFSPFHSVLPKPSNGTDAPAPAKSIRG